MFLFLFHVAYKWDNVKSIHEIKFKRTLLTITGLHLENIINEWCLSSFQLCKKHVHVQKIYFSRWISTFLFTFLFNDPKDNIVIKSSICNYSQYDCGWLTIAFCNWNRWIILLSSFYERLMEENLSLWNSFSALSHTKTWGIISALDKYAH